MTDEALPAEESVMTDDAPGENADPRPALSPPYEDGFEAVEVRVSDRPRAPGIDMGERDREDSSVSAAGGDGPREEEDEAAGMAAAEVSEEDKSLVEMRLRLLASSIPLLSPLWSSPSKSGGGGE